MKLGEEVVEETKAMFLVGSSLISTCPFLIHSSQALEGKISLSLDAWTSSNYYAFLAIVAHYITNDGQCSELSISIYIYLAHLSHQRSYLSISKSYQESIQARTWWQQSGQHWRNTASKTKFVNSILIYFLISFTDQSLDHGCYASNNDMLMEALEIKCHEAGMEFLASDSWMHRECHRLPWGFPGQPAPIPIKTRTHIHGCGF